MENKNFNNKINVSDDDKKDENDILNQSYEDIYSINENKNAIKKFSKYKNKMAIPKKFSIQIFFDKKFLFCLDITKLFVIK